MHGKKGQQKTSCSRVPDLSCLSTTPPMDFSLAMFFCQDVTDHCTLARSADSPLCVCRDHSTPPLLGSKHGMGSLGFRWSYADTCGVLARAEDCTNVHLARVFAGAQKAGLDFHDISRAKESADVLGYEVSSAKAFAVEQANGYRVFAKSLEQSLLVAASVVGQWSSSMVTRLFWRSAIVVNLSILDASFKFARASYLVSGEPWSTVRMEQRASGGILCLLLSNWSLRWLDVCMCTNASEKGFAFAVREGCRELASQVGRVSERTRFKSSSRSIRARWSRRLPGSVVATSGSLGMEIDGVRCFNSRGKHHRSRNTFHLVSCSIRRK